MRFGRIFLGLIAVAYASPVWAQDWVEYFSREEMFRINLPEQPSIEETIFHSEFHAELNAKVFRASEPTVDYTITVVDYGNTTVEYPYNWWDKHGAIDYAAWQIRSRGGEITYDRWAQVDRIRGHHLQITNDNMSRTYAAIHFNGDRLYILEAHAAPGAPPPIQFQQSLGILDENGDVVRYDVDLITRVDPVY
jgi:hypothetical protein